MSLLSSTLAIFICLALSSLALGAQWKLEWSPEANKDGLKAFEGVEDDRGKSHTEVKHIYVVDNNYRFDIHVHDCDTTKDKQRSEVRGMKNAHGEALQMRKGETWKITYSMFMPDSLKATTTGQSIYQMKAPGVAPPMFAFSVRRNDVQEEMIDCLVVSPTKTLVGSAKLPPLRNNWVDVDLEIKIDDNHHGMVKWSLSTDGKQVVSAHKEGVDTLLGDHVHPKWGIYRSVLDTINVVDTYLLITKLRAYKLV